MCIKSKKKKVFKKEISKHKKGYKSQIQDIKEVTAPARIFIQPSFHTNMVSSFESSVVCNVFSKRLFSVDVFRVDEVLAVLVHHALCPLSECFHRGVLPPRPQVPFFIVLTTWKQEKTFFSHVKLSNNSNYYFKLFK